MKGCPCPRLLQAAEHVTSSGWALSGVGLRVISGHYREMLNCAGMALNGITEGQVSLAHIPMQDQVSCIKEPSLQWSPHTSRPCLQFHRTQSSRTGSDLTHFHTLSVWHVSACDSSRGHQLRTPAPGLVLSNNCHAFDFELHALPFLSVALSFPQCFLWNAIDPTIQSLSSKSAVRNNLTPTFQNPKKASAHSIFRGNWNV